jgi:hypothetical protein
MTTSRAELAVALSRRLVNSRNLGLHRTSGRNRHGASRTSQNLQKGVKTRQPIIAKAGAEPTEQVGGEIEVWAGFEFWRGHGLRHVPGHFRHLGEPLQESLLALLQFLADPG